MTESSTYWVDLLPCQVYQLQGRYRSRVLDVGEGPALILLHGTGGHLENYARNIMPLAENFRVVAIDFLWHGRSQTEGFNRNIIPTLVDQIIDVMDKLGIDKANVEGQSLGGWVAMQLAHQYPERVKALVLTTTMGFKPRPDAIPGYVEPDWTANLPSSLEVLRKPTLDNVRTRMARILARPERLTEEAIRVRQALYRQPELSTVQQRFITEYLSGNVITRHLVTEAIASRIEHPALVYWGDQNRTPPAYGEYLAKCLPQGKFHCAADTGHWAQFESADEHNRVVTEFLLEQLGAADTRKSAS